MYFGQIGALVAENGALASPRREVVSQNIGILLALFG
jgi:hypothetical protein